MGGPNPAAFITPPDFTVPAATLAMQSDLGRRALESRQKLLGYAANQPIETWTPDIFGNQGMQTQAAQIAAINAFKNKELEKQINPEVAAVREQLPKMIAEDLKPGTWQKQMDDWAKRTGLIQLLGSGLQDSTVGKSALFDRATLEGMQFRRAQEQAAAQLLAANQQPVAGLDPQSVLNMQNAASANAMQQRAAHRDAMLKAAGGEQQSTTDWVNQMMGSTNQAVESNRKDWQNYQQAMLQSAQSQANSRNALIGAGIGALGTIGGAAIGGPMGAALGGKLAGMIGGAGGANVNPGYMGMQDGMRTYARPGSTYMGYT